MSAYILSGVKRYCRQRFPRKPSQRTAWNRGQEWRHLFQRLPKRKHPPYYPINLSKGSALPHSSTWLTSHRYVGDIARALLTGQPGSVYPFPILKLFADYFWRKKPATGVIAAKLRFPFQYNIPSSPQKPPPETLRLREAAHHSGTGAQPQSTLNTSGLACLMASWAVSLLSTSSLTSWST